MSWRSRPVGWRNESYRHYLSAKGVKTKTYNARKSPTFLGGAVSGMIGRVEDVRAQKKSQDLKKYATGADWEKVRAKYNREALMRPLTKDEMNKFLRMSHSASIRQAPRFERVTAGELEDYLAGLAVQKKEATGAEAKTIGSNISEGKKLLAAMNRGLTNRESVEDVHDVSKRLSQGNLINILTNAKVHAETGKVVLPVGVTSQQMGATEHPTESNDERELVDDVTSGQDKLRMLRAKEQARVKLVKKDVVGVGGTLNSEQDVKDALYAVAVAKKIQDLERNRKNKGVEKEQVDASGFSKADRELLAQQTGKIRLSDKKEKYDYDPNSSSDRLYPLKKNGEVDRKKAYATRSYVQGILLTKLRKQNQSDADAVNDMAASVGKVKQYKVGKAVKFPEKRVTKAVWVDKQNATRYGE